MPSLNFKNNTMGLMIPSSHMVAFSYLGLHYFTMHSNMHQQINHLTNIKQTTRESTVKFVSYQSRISNFLDRYFIDFFLIFYKRHLCNISAWVIETGGMLLHAFHVGPSEGITGEMILAW